MSFVERHFTSLSGSNNKSSIIYTRSHASFCHRKTTNIGTPNLFNSTNIPKMHLIDFKRCCRRFFLLLLPLLSLLFIYFILVFSLDFVLLCFFLCLDHEHKIENINWTELNWTNDDDVNCFLMFLLLLF